ncbi:hypothetical protein F443_05080 [Phytophthora nicotianae P1569]|uniref:ZSWIM1/3 RNaseH-like domain-containing protein n=1 Tax=Phytophthora nicotianae P1569 TaxID=1317065 RepID=V9FJE1_PHYNI|nr:hypothetical protein F443_05080 [Phytophthora nicotianae P1569]
MSSTSSPVPPETTANAVSGARTSLEIALPTFEGELHRGKSLERRLTGKEPDLYDETLKYYARTFICTHGWDFKPRGRGDRTNHTVRGCKARLNAVLNRDKGVYTVRISKHQSTHNHSVGPEEYTCYAETRKIESPGIKRVAKTMWFETQKILRYLKEVSGKPLQQKDVENMIAEMRHVRVSQLLQDFGEGPGNAVRIFRDPATSLTSCITFQTAHMRRMERKFPEALCIDATHGTNCNRYRLFSFMVTDKFGSGAFVQHALIDGETKLNMKCALKAFKENNTAWRDVKVVIVDKDFTEIDVLAEELPDANVILCHFHVIDYLHRETSKRIYGFTSFEKPHVKNLITLMVRTNDEREFDHYLQESKPFAKRNLRSTTT